MVLWIGAWSSVVAVTFRGFSRGKQIPLRRGRRLTEELILDVDEVSCLTDHFNIRVLNAVVRQDPAAPITTASHQLRIDGALLATPFRLQRGGGVVYITSDRMLRPLHPDETFIGPITTLHCEPRKARVPLILVPFDKVPPLIEHMRVSGAREDGPEENTNQDKMFRDVVYAVANEAHGDVVPWHPSIFSLTQFIRFPACVSYLFPWCNRGSVPVVNLLEVHDAILQTSDAIGLRGGQGMGP